MELRGGVGHQCLGGCVPLVRLVPYMLLLLESKGWPLRRHYLYDKSCPCQFYF